MKLCQWLIRNRCTRTGLKPDVCPKNTNEYCEVLPAKKRVAKIKMWAWVKAGALISVSRWKDACNRISCVVSIDKKYIKEAKK